MKTLPIGFRSFVIASRIVAVMDPQSAAAKAVREKAEQREMLIDTKKRRKCRSIIVTDSNHVILSANSPENLQGKIEDEK